MHSIENNLQLARYALNHIKDLQIKSPQSLYTPSYAATTQYKHLRIDMPKFTSYTLASDPIAFGRLEDDIGITMEAIARDITKRYGGYCNPFLGGFGLYRQHGCCAKLPKEVEDARIKEIISLTKEKKIGGCEAQSWVVFEYIKDNKDNKDNIKVEVVALNNYDHWFVIIGQGARAVVCDPWAFNCYPLNELPMQIQGLFRIKAIRKISWWDAAFGYTVVRSNDGKTHYD